MADLDNFFAKKDKKKKTKGKKYVGTSPAEMAKALETAEAPPPPPTEPEKKEFQVDLPSCKAADDEWKEVEEKEQDLEGLKIRSLRVDDIAEEAPENRTGENSDEESSGSGLQTTEQAEATSGASPWQKVTPADSAETTTEEDNTEATPPVPEPEPAKKSGVYIPPSLRNQPPGGRGPGMGRGPGQRRNAPPDITNVEAFPSL